jgi:hypothetical protein
MLTELSPHEVTHSRPDSGAMSYKPVSIISREQLPSSLVMRLPQVYRNYSQHAAQERLAQMALRRLAALVGNPECHLVLQRRRGTIHGLVCWHIDKKQSKVFGSPVGRVEMIITGADGPPAITDLLDRLLAACSENNVRYLTVSLDSREMYVREALELAGFELMPSVTDTVFLPLSSHVHMPDEHGYESAILNTADFAHILEFARSGVSLDCFRTDSGLPADVAGRLASAHILDACGNADRIVAASLNWRTVAYATCKIDTETSLSLNIACGAITSLAVAPDAPGNRTRSFIIQAALSWFSQCGTQIVDVCSEVDSALPGICSEAGPCQVTGRKLFLRKIL